MTLTPEDVKKIGKDHRTYYVKRHGFMQWHVWWRWADGRRDPYNGASEWRATHRPLRSELAAEFTLGDIHNAYRDGIWTGRDYPLRGRPIKAFSLPSDNTEPTP